MIVEFSYGPHDGLELVRVSAPPPIVFVDGKRIFRDPAENRATYRLLIARRGRRIYRHDKNGVRRCGNCKWWTSARFDKCGLCHEPVSSNPVR